MKLRSGWVFLLAVSAAAACGKDSGRQDIVAPNARAANATISASRAGDDDEDSGDRRNIVIRDDCDPTDPGWAPTGGCVRKHGDVSFAEFVAALSSPLSLAVVGHPGWFFDAPYVEISAGATIRVRNDGGRVHTFTEVAQFGAGRVPNPGLNKGLTTAPECPTSVDIAPGASLNISGLAAGDHKFECCIHPWMRASVKVKSHSSHGDH
jgi:plastocyanin